MKRIYGQSILKLFENPKKMNTFLPIISPKIRSMKENRIVNAKAMVAIIDNPRTFQNALVSCWSYALFRLFTTAFIPFEETQSVAAILKDRKVSRLVCAT